MATGWIGAEGELRSLALTRRRLLRMDEDEADLDRRVRDLAERLDIAVPADPVAGAAALVERAEANEVVRVGRDALAPEVAQAVGDEAVKRTGLEAAAAEVASLATLAGAAEDGELAAVATRHRDLEVCRGACATAADAARSAGDGLPVEALRRMAEGWDLDRALARIAELEDRLARIELDIENAIRAEESSAAALRAHGDRAGAAAAVVRREAAAAGLHEAVERYVELTLARDLTHRAIQSVRAERQDPLVRSASAMFERMTMGEFVGLETDVDAKGMPAMVGLKRDGTTRQSVATMSDGTRDQLYLAFRLAGLADYAAAVEPIPLVADDALVHFDDARSAATMELLADFSATTQVLLFTHHESVRDLGEDLARRGRAAVCMLT